MPVDLADTTAGKDTDLCPDEWGIWFRDNGATPYRNNITDNNLLSYNIEVQMPYIHFVS